MTTTPSFSIVVPAFNRASALPVCLDSVQAQSFANWECIVVDDGSSDGTREVAESYCSRDRRFRVVSQPNGGASTARNTGVAESTAEWVAFLDSDDSYVSGALGALAAAIELYPEAFSASGYAATSPAVLPKDYAITLVDAFLPQLGLIPGCAPLSMQSSAIRRTAIAHSGMFNPSYPTAEDWEFLVRVAALGPVATVHAPIAFHRVDGSPGKHDRYLRSGEKAPVVRRILMDLLEHPAVAARLRDTAERERFIRLHSSYLSVLDAVEAALGEGWGSALEHLENALALCGSGPERRAMLANFRRFLYYPTSDPESAAARYARHIRCMSLSGGVSHGALLSELKAHVSDTHVFSAREVRHNRGLALGFRALLKGLITCPSFRTVKSFIRDPLLRS